MKEDITASLWIGGFALAISLLALVFAVVGLFGGNTTRIITKVGKQQVVAPTERTYVWVYDGTRDSVPTPVSTQLAKEHCGLGAATTTCDIDMVCTTKCSKPEKTENEDTKFVPNTTSTNETETPIPIKKKSCVRMVYTGMYNGIMQYQPQFYTC